MTGARVLATVRRRAAADRTEQGRSRPRRRSPARLALAAATAVALAAGLAGCHTQRWRSQLVSVNAAGTDSANDESWSPQLSRDGTKVLFESKASNLGPTDTNGVGDIYVRDLTTGVTELVSVNAGGTDSGDGESYFPSFSPDGTKVGFYSHATNLASPAPGSQTQIYVRDLVADTTTMVTVSADGTGGADDDSDNYGFSPDGTKVLFGSRADNLGAPFTGLISALYERDLTTGVTTRLAPEGHTAEYSPSGDAVAFFNAGNVYLRETSTGTIRLVPAGPTSALHGIPVFSHDGTKLAFTRVTQPGQWNLADIYVYDRVARTAAHVTVGAGGSGGSDGSYSPIHGFHPTDANRLLFSSTATNLVPNDTNERQDLFVSDLTRRTTTRLVSDVGKRLGDDSLALAKWVGNGTKIAFVSWSNSLGVTDTNGTADVYTLRLGNGTYELVSETGAGHDSGNGVSGAYLRYPEFGGPHDTGYFAVSGGGTRIAFGSYATNLGPTDSDRTRDHDVYLATLVTTGS